MANKETRLTMPWWYPNPLAADESFIDISQDPWSQCVLNDFALPGITTVEISKGPNINKKQTAGKHFATFTGSGYKPAELIITTIFWTPVQWQLWQIRILPLIEPHPGPHYKLPTVTIYHPATLARLISAVTIENVTGPTDKGKGIREFKIKCSEFGKSNTVATDTPKIAGFSNALTGKDAKPSGQKIPTHGNS